MTVPHFRSHLSATSAIAMSSLLFAAASLPTHASGQEMAKAHQTIDAIALHRLFKHTYACSEHFDGELPFLGDALGSDCEIQGGLRPGMTAGFVRPFRGDGSRNKLWYGWNAEVLAPFDGKVFKLNVNAKTNLPGHPGKPPAGFIIFERDDGAMALYGHVQGIVVAEGDRIQAGQVVAHVGNNGYARNPHIHVGVWKGDVPYQVRWDLGSGSSTP